MKKYLVTGAAGFIGSHMVDFLIEEGIKPSQLRLMVMKGESLDNLSRGDIEILEGDVRNKKFVKMAMKGINVVYHLAAETGKVEGECIDVNYGGTKNLLETLADEKVVKFVNFSSIAVYGLPAFCGDRRDISEADPKVCVCEYSKSKSMADELVEEVCGELGVAYTIVRPTTVYGPRDKAGIYQLIWAMKRGYFLMIGKGENRMDYVYVGDVVRGARLAEKSRRKKGDYILGSGRPIKYKNLVKAVAKSVGKKVPNWYLPRWTGMGIAHLLTLAAKIIQINSPLSPDRVRVMTADCYFDISKARLELGYEPEVRTEEGMRHVIEWMEGRGQK